MQKGKEITERYCQLSDGRNSVMLPPVPQQTYIDLYPNVGEYNFEGERQRQLDYEAEVKVYRSLEGLKEDLLVLHGFEYSHHQYRLCDISHVRKGCKKCSNKNCANKEGECDFIVIGRNYFVIIEVKNMPNVGQVLSCEQDFHLCTLNEDHAEPLCDGVNEKRVLVGTFKQSLKQRLKIRSLIQDVIDQICGADNEDIFPILHYSAFPNTFRVLFQDLVEISRDERQQVISFEDFQKFHRWWKNNVEALTTENEKDDFINKHGKIKDILVAIWCTDKNFCDESKCSVGKCVLDIDRDLNKGMITFRSSKIKPNPKVLEAPLTIKKFVGVNYLTKEQHDVLQSDQNLLWLNGPAGSGKTTILLAKLIQVVKLGGGSRALLLRFGGPENESYVYKDILKSADVMCELIISDDMTHSSSQLHQLISDHFKSNNQVVVVDIRVSEFVPWIEQMLAFLQNCHLFVDDLQAMLGWGYSAKTQLIDRFVQLSSSHLVWLSCDLMQRYFFADMKYFKLLADLLTKVLLPQQ